MRSLHSQLCGVTVEQLASHSNQAPAPSTGRRGANSQSPGGTAEPSPALQQLPPSSAYRSAEKTAVETTSGTQKREDSSGKFCGDNIILIDWLY